VPIPSARPTSGPVLSSAAPPAPVTQPPPPAAAATPPPSAPIITITETPLAPIAPPPVAATAPSPVAPSQTQAAAPVLTRPEAIAGTHSLPPYPPESKRMGESGKTLMKVTISPQGTASECMVITTSGSGRLDAAACNHVATRWRWKPATRDGAPVATTTAVTVVWSLQSVR
jgi:protein TonB